MARTAYGDAWASGRDATGRRPGGERTWPQPGPGRFEILFHPLARRPAFAVFAVAGPDVTAVQQGGWNLERGFGGPQPNPVVDVEMVSTLTDGARVVVRSASRRSGLPPVHLTDPTAYPSVERALAAAMGKRSAPWRIHQVDVDGTAADLLVLDLDSGALPPGVIGPALLAVATLRGSEVTVVSDRQDVPLVLTTIPADDLVGSPAGHVDR